MTHLTDIPLDIWTKIMFFMNDDDRLVEHFEALYMSGVFAVPVDNKLDLFWNVVSEANRREGNRDSLPVLPPCREKLIACIDKLSEMGLGMDECVRVAQLTNGELQSALYILGWIQ